MAEAGSDYEILSRDIESGDNTRHATYTEKTILVDPLSEKIEYGVNNYENDAEVDKWASSLARMLEDVPHYMCAPGHPGRISRIPENLREVDVKAYEPYFLSIGPYHHGKQKLEQMEKRKRIVLKCFLEQKPELKLIDFLKEIKNVEPVVRSFYSDVQMDSKTFVQMLLFDSFYIVGMFCGMVKSQEWTDQVRRRSMSRLDKEDMSTGETQINNDNENRETATRVNEPREEMRSAENNVDRRPGWFWPFFVHDIFLLENQLPFFLLQKMYVLLYGGSEIELIGIVKHIVGNMLSEYANVDWEIMISQNEEFHHLLHLGHLFFRPIIQQEYPTIELPDSNQMFRLGSALQLYEAGVRFEARTGTPHGSLLDITFGDTGKMVMPCLHVDDNTDSLLRNLIALEQMKYPNLGLHLSAYVVLLLHLVTVPEDVKLLRRKGIIMHHLASDKEMMYMVNRLSVGLSFDYVEDTYSLKPVFHELKRYSERRVPRWRAWLKHRYFSNPWTAISLFAASFLLLLTAIQTYYSVYSYYQPYFNGYS